MKAKRLSKARGVDIITTLPQTIIESILCLLPIEEAARTSILSTEWRYKWTTIPKLVFHQFTVKRSTQDNDSKQISDSEIARRNMDMPCKLFYAIHQVLLLRRAPILDFTLQIYAHHTYFEIDQIILHLSRNHTVKKLTLYFNDTSTYYLPLSFFSLHHLTELSLEYCDIDLEPIFNGFGSLTTLSLSRLSIPRKSLVHLLTNCPSLKNLSLFIPDEQFLGTRLNIMELLKSLPVVEQWTTWGYFTPSFVLDSVPQGLPSSLTRLKYFSMKEMSFDVSYGLNFLAVLLKCSPNLEKIELEIDTEDDFDVESPNLEEYSAIFEKYADVWLEHLNELKIECFRNYKPELELVKFILARSPNLKRVILPTYIDNKNEELELLQTLLRVPRASPVEILVENRCKHKR